MQITTPLDYNELRTISPKAARQAILQILAANKGNVSATARLLGVTRKTVYKALRKKAAGNLEDASRAPKVVPHKPRKILKKRCLNSSKRPTTALYA